MSNQTIVLPKPNGDYLVGDFHQTDSDQLIIACHGMATDRKEPAFLYALKLANRLNLSTFSFDFSGSGDSPGEGGLNVIDRVNDIGVILDHFIQAGKKVTLLGISFSGIATAIATSKFKGVSNLITVNGFFDFDTLTGTLSRLLKIYLFKYPHKKKEIRYYQKHFIPEDITVPTLVIHGKKDTIISPEQSVVFHRQLHSPKQLSLIQDATHELSRSNEIEAVITKAIAWLGHSPHVLTSNDDHEVSQPVLQRFLNLSPLQVIGSI